jgi:hypothetical protein
MKKKPKAAVGDRYDVILTDGGDQMIFYSRPDLERHRGGEPRSHSGPRQRALKRPVCSRA